MSSRADRFVERSVSSSSGPIAPLNTMESFFSNEIFLEEALSFAGVDAEYVIGRAMPAVKRAAGNGVLRRLNLTEEEALVIAAYTVEGRPGSLSMYDVLNRTLRETRDPRSMKRIRMLLVIFLRALRKLPVVEKDRVYRGIDVNLGPSLKSGSTVTWWGFTSVTWNVEITNTFVGRTGGSLFQIEGSCKGYDISELSVFPAESELLIEPETRIKINAVIKMGASASMMQCSIEPSELILQRVVPSNGKKSGGGGIVQPVSMSLKAGDGAE